MPLYRRLPWYKRLRSLRFWQPIQAIEITDSGIRLEKGNTWESASWNDIKNASILKQAYLPNTGKYGGRTAIRFFTPEEAMDLADIRRTQPHAFPRKVGIITSEILSFEIYGKKYCLDISLLTPHFEHDMDLRKILIEKLQPHIVDRSLMKRIGGLFMIACVTLIIAVPLLYSLLRKILP